MLTGKLTATVQIGGMSISLNAERTEEGVVLHSPPLTAGQVGTLSTRTSNTAGIATLASGHGITTGDVVDVYWSGGVAYGGTVSADDATTITFAGLSGDVLPTQDDAIVVGKVTTIDTDFDGDAVEMAALGLDKRGHVHFTKNDGTSIMAQELTAYEGWSWVKDQGISNPLAGNLVGKILASCGEASAGALQVAVLYDSAD